FNTDGNLDITFNNTGYKTFSGTGLMAGQDVVTMPDDKILIVGHVESETESSMLCWKLLPNGSPDNSFGNNGVDTLYTGSENNFAWFAFSNNDSTAIVGGSIFNGLVYQPVLYQLLNDGSLDNSFGLSGVAGKTFDCGKSIQVNGAITFDGKIIYSSTAFENGNNLIGVSQFLSDGNADGSFANNGSISLASVDSIPPDDIIQDFTVLADGKIFCAGINNENRLLYFRIDTNGTLDPTYGVNGYYVPNQRVSTTGFEFNDPGCIIASNELNIFVAQNCLSIRLGDEDLVDLKGSFGVILHKMDTKGNPDSTFGEGGRLRLNFPNQGEDAIECTDLKFQSNGKLLFGAHETHDNGILYGTDNWVFLERLNTDGTIDSTFATNGTQSLNKQEETGLLLLSIREDDKINCLYSYFISRLMPNGSVDSTFLDNCNDSIELGGGSAYQFLLQNDNKMLILILYSYGYYGFQILRYNEEGTVDSAFAINGFLNLSFLNYGVLGCQIQIDNKILACNGQVNGDISVARYFNDGLFDTAFGVNGIANFGGGMLTGANKYLIREQFDGKILIAQKHSGVFFLARLLSGTGTSIDELVNSSLLHIYPNPTTKQLIINDPLSTIEQGVISIADLSGKIIISEIVRFNNNNVIIPVEDLSDGIYFLTLQTENNIQTTKFVKQ
ncbi:MAG: T9SS type A sorting domain-containing protein, partial [Chitinophagales bacterium]|nr:T9SS type A sorting domain-containing protein [Chitinophagales bacterium]